MCPASAYEARSHDAYEERLGSPLEEHFAQRYVAAASAREVAGAGARILATKDRLWAVVPMAERQPELAPVVHQAARYLSGLLHGSQVLFMDGGSCRENVEAARSGGAVVLSQDRILDAVDWKRLLPLLNLDERPYGRAGQGLNVLAGHLALTALGIGPGDLIFQCDADVEGYAESAPLERLILAWSGHEAVRHAKLAKSGRNNEGLMAVRALQQLWSVLDLDWVPAEVKAFGRDVFMALGPDKWMTCGLYLGTHEVVQARLAASGYLDATLQALWSVHGPECGWRNVRHVESPAPICDAENSARKECMMMTSIAMFLHGVVLFGVPVHRWTLRDIWTINRRIMPRLDHVPMIGDSNGPVSIERIETERIIPSPRTLIGERLVDLGRAAQVARRAGAARRHAAPALQP